MPHERSLESDRTHPLPSGLDHVLRPIGNGYAAVGCNGDNITRLEPAVVGELRDWVFGLVVLAYNPRAAHLEFSHRGAVPPHETILASRPYLDARYRIACFCKLMELFVVRRGVVFALQARHGADGRHLGHAPALLHHHAVALLESANHGLRWRRPAHQRHAHGREVVCAGVLVERLQNAQPDGGNTGGHGDALAGHEIEQRHRVQMRTGMHLLRSYKGAGIRKSPRVHVKHGNHRHHHVALDDAATIRRERHEGVQNRRAMRVEHPLGPPRCSRRIAHGRCRALVDVVEVKTIVAGAGNQRFVVNRAGRCLARIGEHDHVLHLHERSNLFPEWPQHAVHQHDLVVRMIDDVGQIRGMQSKIERVQHGA